MSLCMKYQFCTMCAEKLDCGNEGFTCPAYLNPYDPACTRHSKFVALELRKQPLAKKGYRK